MKPGSMTQATTKALYAEMDFIHCANALYWREGDFHTRDEIAEYKRRQDRLNEIRAELAKSRLPQQ